MHVCTSSLARRGKRKTKRSKAVRLIKSLTICGYTNRNERKGEHFPPLHERKKVKPTLSSFTGHIWLLSPNAKRQCDTNQDDLLLKSTFSDQSFEIMSVFLWRHGIALCLHGIFSVCVSNRIYASG